MTVQDAAGVGKAVAKLIHEVSRHFGRFTEPGLIRKNAAAQADASKLLADAEAYRIQTIAQAEAVSRKLLSTGQTNSEIIVTTPDASEQNQAKLLIERTIASTTHDQIREQINKESIMQVAAAALGHEADEAVSDEPVDPDWMARFFDMARHISSEQMQELWGRILAGEVKQPGSYSLRTIELLRNLSKREAELFTNFARFAMGNSSSKMVFFEDNGLSLSDKYAITFDDVLLLAEAGLVIHQTFLAQNLPENKEFVYAYHHQIVIVKTESKLSFPVVLFTRPGTELLNLITSNTETNYLYRFLAYLKRNQATVSLGWIVKREGNLYHHTGTHEVTQEEIDAVIKAP